MLLRFSKQPYSRSRSLPHSSRRPIPKLLVLSQTDKAIPRSQVRIRLFDQPFPNRHHCSTASPQKPNLYFCCANRLQFPPFFLLTWQRLYRRPAANVLPGQRAVRQRRVPTAGPCTASLPRPIAGRDPVGERPGGSGCAVFVQHLPAHAHGQRRVWEPCHVLTTLIIVVQCLSAHVHGQRCIREPCPVIAKFMQNFTTSTQTS